MCLALLTARIELFTLLLFRKFRVIGSFGGCQLMPSMELHDYGTSEFVNISMNRRFHTKCSKLSLRVISYKSGSWSGRHSHSASRIPSRTTCHLLHLVGLAVASMHARQPPCSFTPPAGSHVTECFYLLSCPVGAAVVLSCKPTRTQLTPNEITHHVHEGGMRTAMPFAPQNMKDRLLVLRALAPREAKTLCF